MLNLFLTTAKLKMSTSARELEDLQLKGKTCRIFIGTWGKGDVEKEDLISSFSRHGTIVEEIVYKPNFSFIQLGNLYLIFNLLNF